MRLLSCVLAAVLSVGVAFGQGTPITPPGLQPSGGTATGPIIQQNAITLLSQIARGGPLYNNVRANAAMSSPPAVTALAMWTATTAYTLGQKVLNTSGSGAATVGNVYIATTAGTSTTGFGPTTTGSGITDGTVVWNYVASSTHPTAKFQTALSANSYLWNVGTPGAGPAGLTGVVNFYGGVPANNAGVGCESSSTSTVAGVQAQGGGRWEFVTDSSYVTVRIFNVSANTSYRVIVNTGAGPQYVSFTPQSMVPGGWGYILIDFTAAGGRAVRDITVEAELNTYFCGIDVAATEGVYKPGQSNNALTMVHVGDSFTAAAGADALYDGYSSVMCDYLGVTNCIGLGIGSTGYLDPSTSGTAIQRINDVIGAVNSSPGPVVIVDENIYDDQAFSPAAIQAAALAYMQALRSNFPNTPIFELGVNAAMNGGASWAVGLAMEQAKAAAVAAMNDPLIFFIPSIQAPGGSMMTGTGNDGATNGTGNSDIYTNGATLPHSNTAGHAFMARQWLAGIRRVLLSKGY